jgi:hypothetical protein
MEFGRALDVLSLHDPGAVVHFLQGFKNNSSDWRSQGYVLGSYFGWRCGRDRARHLEALSRASDPFIRSCRSNLPPLPSVFADDTLTSAADAYRALAAWWGQHQARAELVDPWLPILRKQKVD